MNADCNKHWIAIFGQCKPHSDKSKHMPMRHILINMKYDMATQNQSIISQKIKNLSHSETTILTLSVNHREPKHISYGYEIFQTTKIR